MEENEKVGNSLENENVTPKRSKETSDWFLQNLVSMANDDGFEVGITLTVNGFLVSGQLIGGRKYFEKFGTLFESAIKPEEKDSIASKYRELGESVYSDDLHKDDPTYIHLNDVKFFQTSGNPIPSMTGVLWRGRLSEVNGFLLGALTASS